jgi:hypothetical protein
MAKAPGKQIEIDLSQFEETPIRSLKKANKEDDDRVGASAGRGNNLKLVDGTNTLRFAPKRKGEAKFFIQKRVTWLPNPKDDGTIGRRAFEDSCISNGLKFDIINEYLRFAQETLPGKGKAGSAALAILTDRGTGGKNDAKGLFPKPGYVGYAWLKKVSGDEVNFEFGEYEFGRAVRDGLDTCCQVEDPEEEIATDPFTSIKDGHAVLIKYDSKAKKAADYYKVSLSKKPTPLNHEMLLELQAAPTLTSKYRNNYTLRDMESALKAIEYYDADHGIDLCSTDEWEAVVERVRAQFGATPDATDEDDEDETPKSKKGKASGKKAAPVEDDEDEDDEDEAPAKPALKAPTPLKKLPPKAVPVADDDDEDEEEDEDEAPTPKAKGKAAPVAKGKVTAAIPDDEDDEDDDEDEDIDFDEEDEDEEETPAPAKKSAPNKGVEALKGKLKGKK